ncbi:uncharacterized protein LOC144923143 isoform X1 [Branchiostoma floridae x Branchiostoma belcheri]
MSAAGCLVPGFHRQFGFFNYIRNRSESRRVLVDNEETSDTQVEQYTTPSELSCETCTLDNSPLFKQLAPPVTIFRALPIRKTNCTYIRYNHHIDDDEYEATHSKLLCNSTRIDLLNDCCSGDTYVAHCQSDLYISNGRTVLSTADVKVGICRSSSSANEKLSLKNADMDRVIRCKSEGNFDLIKPEGPMLIKSFHSEHEIKHAGDAVASADDRSTDKERDADVITHAGDTVDLAVTKAGQDSSYDVLSRAGDNVLEADDICEENQKLIPKSLPPDENAVFNVKASRSEPVSLQRAAHNVLSLPTKLGAHFVEKTATERKSKLREIRKLFKNKSGTDGIEMETFAVPDDKDSDNRAELTSFIQGEQEDGGSIKALWKRFRSEKSSKIEPESITRMLSRQTQCVDICENVGGERSPGDQKTSPGDELGEPEKETTQGAASTLSMPSNNLAETSDGRSTCDDVAQRPSSLFIKTSQCDLQDLGATSVELPEVTDVYEAAMLICTKDRKASKVTTASRFKLYISGKTKSTEDMGYEGFRKTETGKRSRMKSYHSQPELRACQVEHQGRMPVLCHKSSPEYIVKEPVIKKSPQTCEQNAPLLRLKNRLFKQKAPLLAGGKLKFNLAPPSLANTAPYKVKVNTPRLQPSSRRHSDG